MQLNVTGKAHHKLNALDGLVVSLRDFGPNKGDQDKMPNLADYMYISF